MTPALRPGVEAEPGQIPVVGLCSDDPEIRQAIPEALAPAVAVLPLTPSAAPVPGLARPQALLVDAPLLEHPTLQPLWRQSPRPPVLVILRAEQLDNPGPAPRLGQDFVVWPCRPGELRLRVWGLLDQAQRRSQPIVCGPITIDRERLEVRLAGRPVQLTPKEFLVLQELAQRCDCPVHRQDLLNAVWGWEADSSSNVVDQVVRSLRKKLEPNPVHPRYIVTVRGVGYKLVSSPADAAASPEKAGREAGAR
ncbi:MAG: response regulator transcription factor [Firmicutes bacterium]|nr:response regulator transcription factor [Bacillota bacterium]